MSGNRPTKAYTATVNRISRRYGVGPVAPGRFIVSAPHMVLRVETTATMADAAADLANETAKSYIVMTNREGVREAIRAVANTPIGVMDPYGEIVKPADGDSRPVETASARWGGAS
jgi:hypothetical protein